jgi:hypothetical protein
MRAPVFRTVETGDQGGLDMLFHRFITICAVVAINGSAYAETPKGYLHCTSAKAIFGGVHEIVLYSRTADVDDLSYTLQTKYDSFVLEGPIKIVADMLTPESQIVINRVTGEYFISNRQGTEPESGECIKAQRKF